MSYFRSAATARNPYNVKIVSRISRGAAGKGNLTDPEQRQAGDLVEAELIEKAKLGDAHAFQALYEKHKRRVYSLCLRMTSNTAEAEDLTQEAFLQLYRKIGTFRGESAFSTWLDRLTACNCREQWTIFLPAIVRFLCFTMSRVTSTMRSPQSWAARSGTAS